MSSTTTDQSSTQSAPTAPKACCASFSLNSGMTRFIIAEVLIFATVFLCYGMHRMVRVEWIYASAELIPVFGFIKIPVLIAGCLCLAFAQCLAKHAVSKHAATLLFIAVASLGAFITLQSLEYHCILTNSVTAALQQFWSFYFFATGLLLANLFVAMLLTVILAVKIHTTPAISENLNLKIKALRCYWQLNVAVYIAIFLLFYAL